MKTLATAVFAMAFVLAPMRAEAADDTPPLYYDMGTIHVQFEHEGYRTRTVALSYQIEYYDDNKTTFITAYKPKIESVLWAR